MVIWRSASRVAQVFPACGPIAGSAPQEDTCHGRPRWYLRCSLCREGHSHGVPVDGAVEAPFNPLQGSPKVSGRAGHRRDGGYHSDVDGSAEEACVPAPRSLWLLGWRVFACGGGEVPGLGPPVQLSLGPECCEDLLGGEGAEPASGPHTAGRWHRDPAPTLGLRSEFPPQISDLWTLGFIHSGSSACPPTLFSPRLPS